MADYQGFESFNDFIRSVKDLRQLYDFTYHLYKKENKELGIHLDKNSLPKSFTTSVGVTTHHLHSLFFKSKIDYPYKLRQLVLISLVTSLEVYLSDTILEAFNRDTSYFNENEPIELHKNYIFSSPSIVKVKNDLIKKDIRYLTNGGLVNFKKYYHKRFNIIFDSIGVSFKDVMEVHTRRHLHVHRNGVCDLEYENKYPTSGFKQGQFINITHEYLIDALELFKKFGTKVNEKIILLFPNRARKNKYFYGNGEIKTDHIKLLLEFDLLENKFDYEEFFKTLKVKELSFHDYVVQVSKKDNKCIVIISGAQREISRFFKLLKTHNKISLTNVIELNI